MQSIKLRSKQKQNNQFIIIELQRTSRGFEVIQNDIPQSTKIKINNNTNSTLIHQNTNGTTKTTLVSQPKSFSNTSNGVLQKQLANGLHKPSSQNYYQQNLDHQSSKESRNQSIYNPMDNSQKLRLEMASKIDKIRNEDMIEYENYFRKMIEDDQDYQIPQYQVQQWFDVSQISVIEKQAIPEFFDGCKKSKTPEIYQKYRNYMVLLYQKSPRKYMSFTTIRRNLQGDVNGLIKIYRQLQKWGLINYSCNPIYSSHSQTNDDQIEILNRVGDRLNVNSLKTKADYKYDIDMLNQNIKYLNYKYRLYCQFCEQFCKSIYYQNKQVSKNLNQLCVECYCYLSRNQRINTQDYNKTDITQKQIQQNDDCQQNKYFNANDSQKMIELISQKLGDHDLINKVNCSKKKDEYLMHLLQLPFKNQSYQKVVDDQIEQNQQMEYLESNSKMYFQNLKDKGIKLMDYVYEMVDAINLFNKGLEDADCQNQGYQQQILEDNEKLESLLDECLKVGSMFRLSENKFSQQDIQSNQLLKFINYMWSIRLYVLNKKKTLDDQQKREFIIRFLQQSHIYLVKLKQQDYEMTEKVIRKELDNLEVYRKQQIKSKVENQLEMNQRRTDIETGNKIYIKLGKSETLLANHSYIY